MKKILTLVLILTSLASVGSVALRADPSTPPAKQERTEHHPAIRAAIRSLEHAKAELQAASHDFGGHRAEALAQCDKAIQQLQLALQFDKK